MQKSLRDVANKVIAKIRENIEKEKQQIVTFFEGNFYIIFKSSEHFSASISNLRKVKTINFKLASWASSDFFPREGKIFQRGQKHTICLKST